ncbi:arginine--tRNA ligase [Pseudahrensia aquimaris]|uniref:Arginine--tRNA ligase n=1 Tax=Pseudahrensia aquimaris TaxID=744461 RepID=A0ABW3FJC1_9HYPH
MNNLFSAFEQRIRKIAQDADFARDIELDLSRVTVETPRDPSHGHFATNAAMVLSKQVGKNPRELAQALVEAIVEEPSVISADIAGPGFINIRFDDAYWSNHLEVILKAGKSYGGGETSKGEKVNVEYVSANPTGPMHVGHCRGAVVGDALANLLAFAGYDVTREYYTNDAGGQIEVLARSVFLRYREALGEDIGPMPEGLYPGDYLVPLGQKLAEVHGDALTKMDEDEWLPLVKDAAIDAMMDLIRADLAALGVEHQVFFSERSLHETVGNKSKISETIATLEDMDLVYKGTLPPPKGAVPDDWEDREQLLFRSTSVGDDVDRALMKSNGEYTYFAADIAYFRDKFERGFREMIFILGADHGGYVKRMEALGRAISGGKAKVTIRLCQLVKLYRNGEPFKMSKRSGDFVTLREVVDEVGRDAVRFMMLYRKNDAPLDFDFAKVTEQSKDNPVFYVQYAHARVRSVFRQAKSDMPDLDSSDAAIANADLSQLTDEGEATLIRKMAEYPRIIDAAARAHEPHRLAFYLYELASLLHAQWNRGRDVPALRFINQENASLTLARLALVKAVAGVLASGLEVIGVDAPEEMR